MRRFLVCAVAVGFGLPVSGVEAAVTTNWNTSSSGIFTNPANWDNGAPGSTDTAVFNRGSDVNLTATFSGSGISQPPPVYTIDRLIVRSNSVGFARGLGVNGPSFVANHNSVDPSDRAIVVGQQAGDVATLTTAIPISAEAAVIADANNTNGAVNISSNTWTLSAGGGFVESLIVGNRGVGFLTITNGAKLQLTGFEQQITVGKQAGSIGAILVSGAGSAISVFSNSTSLNKLAIGEAGAAQLTVTSGGHVADDFGYVGGAGQASVDGTDSLWLNARELKIGADPATQTSQSQGSLIVSNGAEVQATLGATINPSGTLGGNSEFICGDPPPHLLRTLDNDGVIAPGFATGTIIGRLSIFGNVVQSATGHIQIQIAGRSGTQYDQLSVNGNAQLGGALDVTLSNFSPQAGDEFNILDFNSSNGAYSSVNLPPISAGLTWDTSQLYTNGIIIVVGPHAVGDYNRDGVVNAGDYTIWRDTLGSKTSLAADGNGNRQIDAGDYDVWKNNFGAHAGSGSFTKGAVPEPATLWLFLAGILTLWLSPLREDLVNSCVREMCRNWTVVTTFSEA